MSLNTFELLVDHLKGLNLQPRGVCSTISVAPQRSVPITQYDALPPIDEREVVRADPTSRTGRGEDSRVDTMDVPSREFSRELSARQWREPSGPEARQQAPGFDPFASGAQHTAAFADFGQMTSANATSKMSHFEDRMSPRPESARNLSSRLATPPKTGRSMATVAQRVMEVLRPKIATSVEGQDDTRVTRRIGDQDVVGEEFDIPEDTYGAAILAIVKEMQEVYRSVEQEEPLPMISVMRCGFALSLLAFNLLMQGFLLVLMKQQVVMPAVHHVQTRYREFHQQAFDAHGHFRHDLWSVYEGKDELCQIAMTNIPFYMATLFVWTTAILFEFRTTENLFRDVHRMPVCDHGDVMLLTEPQTGLMSIIALTRWTRVMLFVFVCLPKLVISLYLLLIGYQWLSATTSFESLVMNTVSMEFVLRIDELFFTTFMPVAYRKKVQDINFFVPETEDSQRGEEAERQDEWRNYWISLIYVLAGFSLVVLYTTTFQSVLPHSVDDVREHCRKFMHSLQPICDGTESNCYPYGTDEIATRRLRGFA